MFYKRHLPHYQPEDATFHVVFRLAGSLPRHAVEQLREEQKRLGELLERGVRNQGLFELFRKKRWGYFRHFNTLLNGTSTGPHWLRQYEIAEIVKETMHYRDSRVYDLIAYSIMPNHVHMIVENVRRGADTTKGSTSRRDSVPSNGALTYILASLKKYTALRANRVLHRSGAFWQDESYDHVIRDDAELERTIWYLLQNPVSANLVVSWEQWPWNYCKWSPE